MYTVTATFTRALPLLIAVSAWAQQLPLVYPGGPGPGRGKQIVLIAGDQEYRAEESVPALAQILAGRHGFHCTVLFSINRQTGKIDPNTIDNIPGLEALRRADLVVFFARWLELPGKISSSRLCSRARETAIEWTICYFDAFSGRDVGQKHFGRRF